MEQNLNEKERKQRLAIGLIIGALAALFYYFYRDPVVSGILGLASLGFIFNYFTCFCGTKRLIAGIKNKFS